MEETVFDPLRKKHVALTPEERVRQFFIRWLHEQRHYPLQLMSSEHAIRYGKKNFRCDIVAFSRELKPLLIVECKAPQVKVDDRVMEQIVHYNLVLKVPHLVLTNGNTTYICSYNARSGRYEFAEDIPDYASF